MEQKTDSIRLKKGYTKAILICFVLSLVVTSIVVFLKVLGYYYLPNLPNLPNWGKFFLGFLAGIFIGAHALVLAAIVPILTNQIKILGIVISVFFLVGTYLSNMLLFHICSYVHFLEVSYWEGFTKYNYARFYKSFSFQQSYWNWALDGLLGILLFRTGLAFGKRRIENKQAINAFIRGLGRK